MKVWLYKSSGGIGFIGNGDSVNMLIPQGFVFRIVEKLKKKIRSDSFGNLIKTMSTNFSSSHTV
jgi:hypothetical protein